MVSLTLKEIGDTIQIKMFSPNKKEWAIALSKVKRLDGARFDGDSKCWVCANSEANKCTLLTVGRTSGIKKTQDSVMSRCPPKYLDFVSAEEFIPNFDVKERQKRLIDEEELNGPLVKGLRNYQIDFLKFMIARNGKAILSDSMGTGKTLQSLAWLAYSDSFPALIVVTAPTKLQWEREYNRWLEDFPNSQPVQVLRGQTPTRIYAGTTVIINWDILHYWEKELKRCKFRCIIGDEAQAIGNPDSKRAKAFIKLSESIPSCIVMSGTPARSRPAQYWSMIHCVEPTLFPDYKAYLWRYCDPKFTPFSIQPTFNGAKNTTELHYRLMKCMLRRTKEEVMTELPSKQVEVVPLEVDESFKDEYSIAEDELKTSTNSELRMKVAALGRCAYLMKEKSLIKWTEELLDSSGEKVVIFCWHRDVVDLLMEGFAKYNPTKIYGGMSLRDREDSKAKFISDESCRVIVGNIQALGTGVDGLQKVCCKAIFAEFANTITDSLQAEDRLHRGGQDKQVTIYYTCAKDTIDETMMKALDDKRKVLDSVLNGKETDDSDLLSAILKRYNNK